MTRLLIAPDLFWRDGRLVEGQAVEIEDGEVRAIRLLGSDTPDAAPHLLLPMLTDIQVNGGGGVMVNSNPTPEGLRAIAAAHRELGTGWILPTIITDAADVMEQAADAAIAVKGEKGQLGLHIEGPHIAAERKGTHDARHIRPLDERTVRLVERLRTAGVTVMITLAPELADPALLRRLVSTGAIVSAGHSMASADEARHAIENGITCFTHLYNAMPPMTSRAPGIVAAAINSRAYCGMIADGIHVSWDMLKIAIAARPVEGRCFLVSDAMATVNGPLSYTLYGQEIHVEGGALVNAQGSLAGAHIDMVTSLANIHRHVGVPLETAITMASDVPRAVLGLPPQAVTEGWPAGDLLALDEALSMMELPS